MYDLEIEKVARQVKRKKFSRILIQLPDGLKPRAKDMQKKILAKTDCEVFIWAGSCFGACDVPNLNGLRFDAIFQWGHSEWKS